MILNKNKKSSISKALVLLGLVTIFSLSCKKVLDVDSTHVAAEEKQWKSVSDTRSALFGTYGLFRAALAENNGHWLYGEMRLGDFQAFSKQDLKAISKNKLNASYPIIQELADWRRFYAIINAASVLIENAPKVLANDKQYSELFMKYDIAQARALRAFAYFYMVRIWGDVPLVTAAYDNGSFEERPRNSASEVLSYAENELLSAAADLPYLYAVSPQTYYNMDEATLSGTLLNKVSAYAILSHIAAWQGNYIKAESYTGFVLNNYQKSKIARSSITVLTAVDGLFSKRSPSQMVAFGFMDANKEATRSGHIENLTLARPFVEKAVPDIYVPKDSILKIFDNPFDLRFGLDTTTKTVRTNYFTNFNGEVPIFSKIKVIRDGITGDTFELFGSVILFTRLEEIILLRAETLAALNRIDESVSVLNSLLGDRGLPIFVREGNNNIVDAIFAERRRELMGEGWRWYDKIRYQRLRQNDPSFAELIAKNGIYWPLSQKVLSSNSLLIQNNYWN